MDLTTRRGGGRDAAELIVRTLHKHTGNQTEIARALHTQRYGITEKLDRQP